MNYIKKNIKILAFLLSSCQYSFLLSGDQENNNFLTEELLFFDKKPTFGDKKYFVNFCDQNPLNRSLKNLKKNYPKFYNSLSTIHYLHRINNNIIFFKDKKKYTTSTLQKSYLNALYKSFITSKNIEKFNTISTIWKSQD